MQPDQKSLILVLGSTGNTGYHIARRLIELEQNPVRLLVRSPNKVTELFGEREIGFENIISGSLTNPETLQKAFEPSAHFGPVKIVISALGAKNAKDEDQVAELQYVSQVCLINTAVFHKVEKYLLITSMLITRQWHPIAFMLNSFVPNVMHWKGKAENHLRNSGLQYQIIRPPRLDGGVDDARTTGYTLIQRDQPRGALLRSTVAEIVIHALNAPQFASRVTYGCLSASGPCEPQNFTELRIDTSKDIVVANHRLGKKVYKSIGWFLLLGTAALLCWKFYFSRR